MLYTLLDEASKSANTTAVMSAFLKSLTRKSLHTIELRLPHINACNNQNHVYCHDSLELLNELNVVDILYLDPPYTKTQYAAAYHILETIARWDFPNIFGISGKRDLTNLISPFSRKSEAFEAIKYIVSKG